MHLLESKSDIIQPVEVSYELLTGDISSVKMNTVDILLALQVLHAKYILNSGRGRVYDGLHRPQVHRRTFRSTTGK
jgi:hypothetical protein